MKIAQVCMRYYPALGGVEEYVKRISEGIIKNKNYQVKIITSDLEQHFSNKRIKTKINNINGVEIKRHYAFPLKFRKYTFAPGMFWELLKEKFDLIHAHSYMYFSADCALITSRIKKLPLIFNPYLSEFSFPSIWGKFYRKSLGKMLMQADLVISISKYEEDLIRSWGYLPSKIIRISPGVDLDEFVKADYNIYKNLGIDGEIILFVGRLDYMKGGDLLIKAFSLIHKDYPNWKIVLAGSDFGEKIKLEKLIKDLNLNDKIYFLGALKRHDLISAYKGAKIFVLPSRYEAFGIVLIEAMAAKIPVIATRYSAIPDIVMENQTGLLFNLEDFNDLALKLKELIKNEKLKNNLIKNAYNLVTENYTWENCINKFKKTYESLN
ncbi:MAG: glycosyltransferase family 4 protein [Armatimonadetes bacterium]|nr:glycosyltransferase family 4 protein [Armatimonadota bacterium]